MKVLKRVVLILLALATAIAGIWYCFFALQDYSVSEPMLVEAYAVSPTIPNVELVPIDEQSFALSYISFDGEPVNGRLLLPENRTGAVPVMIGIHGMGRAHVRWWQASYKGRPTLEQTNKITELALENGYAVIAIDARNHGERKNPDHTVRDLMIDLHVWGKREPYENMIIESVKDHRVLMRWLETDPRFNGQIAVAGYSMGAQISLLLSAFEPTIKQTLAIVPPHIGQGTALVAPSNVAANINQTTWFVSATDDEYASQQQNKQLFGSLASNVKQHLEFTGGHILPEGYYQQLAGWF